MALLRLASEGPRRVVVAESSSLATTARHSGPRLESTIVFISIVDGDSSYNRRHKTGHFKGEPFPFGALVDFMPQNDTRMESMGAKTIVGVFIGYHVHAGGLWSGDYLVADLAPFRQDCDVVKSVVKIHRIKEVVKVTEENISFSGRTTATEEAPSRRRFWSPC
jgi:hypothetical protein